MSLQRIWSFLSPYPRKGGVVRTCLPLVTCLFGKHCNNLIFALTVVAMSREAQKLYRREFEAKEEDFLALKGYTFFCTSLNLCACACVQNAMTGSASHVDLVLHADIKHCIANLAQGIQQASQTP